MARQVVVGQEVADTISALKTGTVKESYGMYDSEALCAFQRKCSQAGYIEAELVLSMYGWSVRYASGLQNFGLLASCRARMIDGTYEDAVRWATEWARQDPTRRYVTAQK